MKNKRPHSQYIKCPTCSKNAWEHRHSMSQGLAVILLKFVKAWNGTPVNLTDQGFTHNEKCNFQKLKHFNLVVKRTGKEGGSWRLTQKGKEFALGKRLIPKHVWTYNDHVIEEEPEQTRIVSCLKDNLYWKRYPSYVNEMRSKFECF